MLDARRSQEIFESIDAIIWEFCADDFTTTYVSPQIERILGYPFEEASDDPNLWRKIVHPDYLEEVMATCNERTQDMTRYDFEYPVRAADGEWCWMRDVTTVVREEGQPLRYRCILTNITQRHAAQEELERSRQRLAEAQRIAKLGDWEWDVAKDVITWSDQCFRIFGFEPQSVELDLDGFHALLAPEAVEMLNRAVSRALEKRQSYTVEHPITRTDGSTIIVRCFGEPLCEEDGEVTVLRGTIQDVTARHEVEQLKDRLIALVSHELRTPLTPLVGLISLLGTDDELRQNPRLAHMIDMASKNADRLVEVVDEFVEIRELAGEVDDTFAFEQVNLYDILLDALDRRSDLEDTHVVSVHTPDALVPVMADRRRLCVVIANLLANAEKFSPEDSPVDISLRVDDKTVRLSIRDHGPGIDDGFRARVFERFSQADRPSERAYGGVGLGLAIAKKIIDRHDGHIHIESPADGGTRAVIELPTAS